jgi:hypothetical protein
MPVSRQDAPVAVAAVSFAPEEEVVVVADTIFVTGNSREDDDATVTINSIPNNARHVRL